MKKIIAAIAVSSSLLLTSGAQAQVITYDPGVVGTFSSSFFHTFHDLDGAAPLTLELDFVFSGSKQFTVRNPGLALGSLYFHLDSFGGGVWPAVAFLTDMDGNNILDASVFPGFPSGAVQSYGVRFDLFSGLEFHGLHLSLDMSDLRPGRIIEDANVSFGGENILMEITEFTSPPVDPGQVSEPGSLLLLSLGLLGLSRRFRKSPSAVV